MEAQGLHDVQIHPHGRTHDSDEARERVASPGRRVAHEFEPTRVQRGVVACLHEARGSEEMAGDEHDEVFEFSRGRARTPAALPPLSLL